MRLESFLAFRAFASALLSASRQAVQWTAALASQVKSEQQVRVLVLPA